MQDAVNIQGTEGRSVTLRLPEKPTPPKLRLPKYVSREISRHGKVMYYYRLRGKRTRIYADPSSPEFAVEVARATHALPPRVAMLYLPYPISSVLP